MRPSFARGFVLAVFLLVSPLSRGASADTEGARECHAAPKIVSGTWHVCAILGDADDRLRCWGGNLYGALGDGTARDSATPRFVRGLGPVVDVAAGYTHTCAIARGGAVYCWGEGRDGEIGDGANVERHLPARVVGIDDAVAVAAGTWRSCALRADRSVWCWGNDVLGGLGNGLPDESSNVPVRVLGIDDAIAIAAGEDHACALRATGAVRCWGRNQMGQLGDGTTIQRDAPVDVLGVRDAVSIATGYAHTCVVTKGGAARCWGANWYGMLGDGTTTNSLEPVEVSGVTSAASVAIWNLTTCATMRDGTARCWGSDAMGQLGDGGSTQSTVPVTPSFVLGPFGIPLGGIMSLSAGDTSCAIVLGGAALCWGANYVGQVGDGTKDERPRPTLVHAW
jgi:alpha-tubulin suppressor-like RCC1 family protein